MIDICLVKSASTSVVCWSVTKQIAKLMHWCLVLDAWTPARPIHKGFHKRGRPKAAPPLWRRPRAASLCGWVWQVFKHRASSIKHLFCHQSTHHGSRSTFDQTDIDYFSARVFFLPNFEISRFSILEHEKRFGIINPVQNRLVSIRTVFRSLQNH